MTNDTVTKSAITFAMFPCQVRLRGRKLEEFYLSSIAQTGRKRMYNQLTNIPNVSFMECYASNGRTIIYKKKLWRINKSHRLGTFFNQLCLLKVSYDVNLFLQHRIDELHFMQGIHYIF